MINLQHDVVSLLYSIKGRIETLFCKYESGRAEYEDNALPDAHAALRIVYSQTQQALDVTKRIASIIKEAPRLEASTEVSRLRTSWDHALGCIRSVYTSREIDYVEHIPEDFPNIACKQEDLTEIFYCLADNALQAMNARGLLVIRASLGNSTGGRPTVVIAISDNGPGISAAVLGSLFSPFVTTKPPGQGNGLGLCLVQGLARRNGGQVSMTSFEGFGTTVTLTFSKSD